MTLFERLQAFCERAETVQNSGNPDLTPDLLLLDEAVELIAEARDSLDPGPTDVYDLVEEACRAQINLDHTLRSLEKAVARKYGLEDFECDELDEWVRLYCDEPDLVACKVDAAAQDLALDLGLWPPEPV